MSDKSITNLKDIFESHYDTPVMITVGKLETCGKLMSKEAFIEIVTKLVKTDSRGNAHKTIEELHKSLDIS